MGKIKNGKPEVASELDVAPKGKVYFSGLNGLRFIAATLVIIHHIEQNKSWREIPSIWGKEGYIGNFVDALGHHAVSFFFVLSGFLISYLLLDEHKKYGDINVRKFYIRRLLRIWPLYYLLFGLAIFFLPQIVDLANYPERLLKHFDFRLFILFFIMLPNVVRLSPHTVMGLNQTWSIGVEEQFYLIWPVLVRKFKNNFFKFLVIFIILKMLIGLILIGSYSVLESGLLVKRLKLTAQFWDLLQIEQMAIGAIGAYFLFIRSEKFFKIIYSPSVIIISLWIWLGLVFLGSKFFGHTILEGIVFIIIIMNLSVNKNFPLKLEGKWINFMGNISYGIYMYHTLVIAIVLNFLLPYFSNKGGFFFNLVLYVSVIISTWLIAAMSYKYFEMPFLKLKKKFQLIKSGD